MANQEHLDLLKQGVNTWNEWRFQHSEVKIDLRQADLRQADLSGAKLWNADFSGADLDDDTYYYEGDFSDEVPLSANLSGANLDRANLDHANLYETNLSGASLFRVHLIEADLHKANLSKANLSEASINDANLHKANLSEANLHGANLSGANLSGTNLSEANLHGANLSGTNLSEANLHGANLSGANLSGALLVETNLTEATLTQCTIYGISVWNVQLEGARQENLVITGSSEPVITVDNLEVAQFIHLLLNNKKLRDVIDTITSKVVLILGRFTSERKATLDAIRNELRSQNYLPVLFDFEKPANRDLTETVSMLAHLARFIIVDLTDPSSAPHEVATVIPHTVVPVQPLLWQEPLMIDGKAVVRREYAMFEDLRRRYHWVLPTFRYQDATELLVSLQAQIIAPAEQKAKELMQFK